MPVTLRPSTDHPDELIDRLLCYTFSAQRCFTPASKAKPPLYHVSRGRLPKKSGRYSSSNLLRSTTSIWASRTAVLFWGKFELSHDITGPPRS